jgi:hypothetical protein
LYVGNIYKTQYIFQDYPSADEVWVRSTGQVILDKVLNIEQNTTDDQVYVSQFNFYLSWLRLPTINHGYDCQPSIIAMMANHQLWL